jgi:hypothetical protein
MMEDAMGGGEDIADDETGSAVVSHFVAFNTIFSTGRASLRICWNGL